MTSDDAPAPRPAGAAVSARRVVDQARSLPRRVRDAVPDPSVTAKLDQLRADVEALDARLRAHIDAAAGAAVEAAIAAARHHAEAAVAAGTEHAVATARAHTEAAVAAAVSEAIATATAHADDADARQGLAVQRSIDHAVRVATDSITEHMRRSIEIAVARARSDVQRSIDVGARRSDAATRP